MIDKTGNTLDVTEGLASDVNALALDSNNALYAGGYFTSTENGTYLNHIARLNGTTWQPLGAGLDNTVTSLAADGSSLYAGGNFTSPAAHLARWDGTNWSAVGGGLDDSAKTLMVKDNKLYVGGYFTHAGGNYANHLAIWDGSNWSTLGSGTDGGDSRPCDFSLQNLYGGEISLWLAERFRQRSHSTTLTTSANGAIYRW